MILKVGFLVGASIAAFAVTQISSNSTRNCRSSMNVFSENCDSRFQERDFEEEENEKKATVQAENQKGHEQAFELEFLKNVVEEMEQRGMSQEKELLELYDLKQQRLCFAHLQNQLKAKIMKIDMLNAMKNALTAERMKLHEDINKNLTAKNELEIAKERIKEIRATKNKDDDEMKEQIQILKEHFLGFNKNGVSIIDNNIAEKKLRAMKDAELEVAAMKRKNRELQLEARELGVELDSAEARVAALSNMTEENVMANVEAEINCLKHTNGDLLEMVEKLQKNRFDMIEELVYQRWLNACLRFEIQDYNTPREMKPKHDLKKKLSFDSHVRVKRASLDSISSRTSSMDSDETSHTTTCTTPSYSSDQKSAQKKFSLIHSVRRWGKSVRSSRSKEDYMSGNIEYSASRGVIRRFSMSDVPSRPSILRNKIKQDLIESPEMPTPRRARRVSFSNSINPKMPISSDAPKLGASKNVTEMRWVELKIPTSSDSPNLEASEDVTETSWVELKRGESEISAPTNNANDSGKLRQEDMGDDKGESQMVNNGEIGQTEDHYPGMIVEELGNKAKSNIEDQNLHSLPLVIFIFLILLVLFIVLLFRLSIFMDYLIH